MTGGRSRILCGDVLDELPKLDARSFDAVLCDPPYGLSFMGKAWDHGVPGEPIWRLVSAALKPGAPLLAFGGTRTYHRLACAIEDAGFEIRDSLCWLYGSGFPKSLDISKAIDKAAGAERELRVNGRWAEKYPNGPGGNLSGGDRAATVRQLKHIDGGPLLTSDPVTDLARQWSGYGTALKPAWEPCILAMKPTDGTFAQNAERWGVAGVNVDGGRIEVAGGSPAATRRQGSSAHCQPGTYREDEGRMGNRARPGVYAAPRAGEAIGRWPANLLLSHHPECREVTTVESGLDHEAKGTTRKVTPEQWECHPECPVRMLDEQSGERKDGTARKRSDGVGMFKAPGHHDKWGTYGASGGASRFFYCAKASRSEREAGLHGIEIVMVESPSWDDAGRKAKLRVDTGQSPPRVISGYGMSESDATEWSTFLLGKPGTAPSLTDIRFTTATGTSSTTESRTLSWLARSLTSGCTADASGAAGNGGSPAESAESSTPQLTTTAARTVSLPGVGTVASGTRLRISGNAGSPADHPTVKPLALCEYLARLILPPKRDTPRRLLVPFSGSGSEMIGALLAGWDEVVGIEMEAEYVAIAEARIAYWLAQKLEAETQADLFG